MQKKTIVFNKEGIPDTHFFVYKNENYPFKFDFFKHSSKYFSENKKQLKKSKYIPLVDEEKTTVSDFRPEWILDFINFVQCQEITLHTMNVLCLNYLSNVYEIDTLQTVTNQYISTNQDELVLQLIILHQNDSKFNTSKYEDIISCKIEQYIENDDLLKINIQILQRIFKKFVNKNKQLKNEICDKILTFLMKCLDKYGSLSSVLFSDIEIVKSSPEILDKFMNNYSNVFDFCFLNKNDFINLYKEKKQLESEYKINEEVNQEKISKMESNARQLENDIKRLENDKKQLENDKIQFENDKIKLKNDNKQLENDKIQLENDNKQLKNDKTKLENDNKQLKNENKQYKSENENLQNKINKYEIIQQKEEIEKLKSKNKELEQNKGFLFEPCNSKFNGIINHLQNQSNQIVFTASSVYNSNKDSQPINVTKFEDYQNAFLSENKPGSWICLDFKEHRIIPTHYTLKSTTKFWFKQHPKNWIFEGSVDQKTWTTLDEQKNCEQLHGYGLIYTFKVQNQSTTEFRYFRIRSTGPNWNNENYLLIDSIEIYGKLI